MARRKEAPFHIRSDRGRAVLDYALPGGGRKKVSLGLPYDGGGRPPSREVQQAAESLWRERTEGRVVEEHARIATTLHFGELYRDYCGRWTPPDGGTENDRQALLQARGVRISYGNTIIDWAKDDSRRPDGSVRWRGDKRTPLERIASNDGAVDFLTWRLERVLRKSMKKEKSNLCLFFNWLKAEGYIKSIPVVTLPVGAGRKALVNGRGYVIEMTPLDAAKIVAALPEWSSKPSRKSPKPDAKEHVNAKRFLVRPFFELMSMTGLREVTLARLDVPRSWRKGRTALALDSADDKAKYGRQFPLTKAAVALLTKYAPTDGAIFGHHDFRAHVKAAAKIVFVNEPEKAKRFGGYHLRHFLGTHLANAAGTKLPSAQFVLGHKDLGTTSAYVHANSAGARELLEHVEVERQAAADDAAEWMAKRTAAEARRRSPTAASAP